MKLNRNKIRTDVHKIVEIPDFFYEATLQMDPLEFASTWSALMEKLFHDKDPEGGELQQAFVKLAMMYYGKDDE